MTYVPHLGYMLCPACRTDRLTCDEARHEFRCEGEVVIEQPNGMRKIYRCGFRAIKAAGRLISPTHKKVSVQQVKAIKRV